MLERGSSFRAFRIPWLIFAWIFCACSSVIPSQAAPTFTSIPATPTYTRMPGGVLANGLESPDIRGRILFITQKNGRVLSIFVEGTKEKNIKYDKADIGITDQTLIYMKSGEKIRQVSANLLHEGMIIEAIFYLANDIYPVQARAWEILILSG